MYLNINGVFCGSSDGGNSAAPGECYYYQNFDRYKIGIRLHLYTILRKHQPHRHLSPSARTVTNSSFQPPLSSSSCNSLLRSDRHGASSTASTATSSSY